MLPKPDVEIGSLSIVEGVVLMLEFEGGGMKEEWSKEDIQMEERSERK